MTGWLEDAAGLNEIMTNIYPMLGVKDMDITSKSTGFNRPIPYEYLIHIGKGTVSMHYGNNGTPVVITKRTDIDTVACESDTYDELVDNIKWLSTLKDY